MQLWVIVLLAVVIAAASNGQTWDIREHLGTQSPYWSEGSTSSTPPPATCSPIHLNLLSRHGARYPTNGDITALIELEKLVKQYNQYINDSFPYIKAWTNPYPINQQGYLSTSGQEELYHMGQRYNSTYPSIFSTEYYPDVYFIQSTQIPRTGVSASSFVEGFLQGRGDLGSENYQPTFIFSNTTTLDYLRFFDNCPQYTAAMANGVINTNESDAYGDENYPQIAARVAQILGVTPYWNITVDVLDAMFTACAFEVSVFNRTDGWCALFSPDDIMVYEYAADLEDYYEKSYGSGIGYQISAVILQSMVTTMQLVMTNASGYQYQQAYLRFAHAEDILPFAALLGLFKNDYPLTANLTAEQISNRNWTASIISPFGANIAFVLYQCDAGEYKVKLTHNEVEYVIPGCGDLFCPISTFTSIFASELAFNFTQACALPSPTPSPSPRTVSVAVLAISIIFAFAGGIGLSWIAAYFYTRKQKSTYSSLRSP